MVNSCFCTFLWLQVHLSLRITIPLQSSLSRQFYTKIKHHAFSSYIPSISPNLPSPSPRSTIRKDGSISSHPTTSHRSEWSISLLIERPAMKPTTTSTCTYMAVRMLVETTCSSSSVYMGVWVLVKPSTTPASEEERSATEDWHFVKMDF